MFPFLWEYWNSRGLKPYPVQSDAARATVKIEKRECSKEFYELLITFNIGTGKVIKVELKA